MDNMNKEMELRVTSLHFPEQYEGGFRLTIAGEGMEQRSGTGLVDLAPDSVLRVLSDESLGTHQVDVMHGEMKYPVISTSSFKLYEGRLYLIHAGSGVKQEARIGLASDLATRA